MCLGQNDNADLKTILREKGLWLLKRNFIQQLQENQKDTILKYQENQKMFLLIDICL